MFRFGGEEFVVIADELTRAAALALGERIRRDVASHMEADVPLVTVSIGLATCAEDASDYEGLFDCADRRLYLAKSAGRNCVIGETGTDAGAPKLAWAGWRLAQAARLRFPWKARCALLPLVSDQRSANGVIS